MGKMRYGKYVGVGVAILVVACLLVNSTAATKTVLKEGDVDLARTSTIRYDTPDGGIVGWSPYIILEPDLRESHYKYYNIYDTKLRNRTANPQYIVQPITLWVSHQQQVGRGTLTIDPIRVSDNPNYWLVNIKFSLAFNQTWQNEIKVNPAVLFYDENGLGAYTTFNNEWRWAVGKSTVAARDVSSVTGICLSETGYPGSAAIGGDYITASTEKEFYNEYEIFADYGFRQINVIRVCPECTNQLTKSRVYVLDRNGDLLMETAFKINENTEHPFSAEPIAIWLCAANMESDGTEKCIKIYDDTDEIWDCSIRGYTYDAEKETTLSDVSIAIDSIGSDVSDASGYYSIGFPPNIYTITANRGGYYDTVMDGVMFSHDGDYGMDIGLIPEPPVSTNPCILGLVRTLPRYYPAKNQVVTIENATWSLTSTTNDFGYYIFQNLKAGDYEVEVLRKGYEVNSHLVTVSDYHVLHNIDLEPKGWNIIELINEWFMKWWWLVLLLIALIVGALLVKGREKGKKKRTSHRK